MRVWSHNKGASNALVSYYNVVSGPPASVIFFQLSYQTQGFQKDVNKHKLYVLDFSNTRLEQFKFQEEMKKIVRI